MNVNTLSAHSRDPMFPLKQLADPEIPQDVKNELMSSFMQAAVSELMQNRMAIANLADDYAAFKAKANLKIKNHYIEKAQPLKANLEKQSEHCYNTAIATAVIGSILSPAAAVPPLVGFLAIIPALKQRDQTVTTNAQILEKFPELIDHPDEFDQLCQLHWERNRLEEKHRFEVGNAFKRAGEDFEPNFDKANLIKNQITLKEIAISTLESHIKTTIVDPEYS